MTTETRQAIQYLAMGLFALFTVAILGVFVYGYVHGTPPDGTILAYVGAVLGTITAILGVNSGASTTQQAMIQANQNTAAVVAAATGASVNAPQAAPIPVTPDAEVGP